MFPSISLKLQVKTPKDIHHKISPTLNHTHLKSDKKRKDYHDIKKWYRASRSATLQACSLFSTELCLMIFLLTIPCYNFPKKWKINTIISAQIVLRMIHQISIPIRSPKEDALFAVSSTAVVFHVTWERRYKYYILLYQ